MNADDPQYDAEFAQHPLSRVRRMLRRVEETATLSAEVRAAEAFALPMT
jgi:hypothetical protein